VLADGVHSLMPAEAAQLEMTDLNDWFGNSTAKVSEGPAEVLAE